MSDEVDCGDSADSSWTFDFAGAAPRMVAAVVKAGMPAIREYPAFGSQTAACSAADSTVTPLGASLRNAEASSLC